MGHSVLPKSTHENRIKENFDVFDWCIPDDLFAKFSEIQQVKLFCSGALFHKSEPCVEGDLDNAMSVCDNAG